MLKSIGFSTTDDASYSVYGRETLGQILAGKVNPFRLKEVKNE